MLASPHEALEDLLLQCRDDPDLFNAAILGRADYWWRQLQICEAIVNHDRVVVPTGNSVGKSYLAAGLALWWLFTRPGSLVVCTAPSQTLLGTVLFKEIRRAKSRSILPLPGDVTDSPAVSPQEVRVNAEGWQILGIATKGVERLSGQHHPDLFQIVDEGSGVDDPIWEALDSQNPAKRITFGNPLKAEGRFYADHKKANSEEEQSKPERRRLVSLPIPSTDSPDIDLERSPRGLADRQFIEDTERDYGRGTLYWLTHVDAKFPDATEDVLIPPAWVDRCADPGLLETCDRLRKQRRTHRRLAVDLGYGTGADRTVLVVADDFGVLHLESSNTMGVPETAARMAELARIWHVDGDRITFDANGPGRDLPRYLEQHRLEAQPYHGSGKGGPKHANKRSRCAWRLRQRLDPARPTQWGPEPAQPESPWEAPRQQRKPEPQPPFSIPPQFLTAKAREELKALRYHMDGPKIALEVKEDLVKRLGRSPDLADALIMLFSIGDVSVT